MKTFVKLSLGSILYNAIRPNSYKAKRIVVFLKINKFIKKQNFRKKILTLILKILVINSFTGKVVFGEENSLIKQKIRNIKIKNPNNKIEKFEITINLQNDSRAFIQREDIENFTKINRETMKKLEQEEKDKAAAEQAKQDEIKKKADQEAKALEEKKKKEEEEKKPWVLKAYNSIKTFFTPTQVFYNSIKLGLSMPQNNSISAYEVTISGNSNDLFKGTDSNSFMPFVGISAGFNAERLFRYELELSYFLFAGKPKDITNNSIYSTSAFDISSKTLNFGLLNLSLNGFLKLGIPDFGFDILKGSEVFIGGGIGVGYAIPKSSYLRSAFVLPTFQAMAGFTLPINNRFKANVYWKMLYANISFQNQNAFADLNGIIASNRAISNGSLELKNFTAHFLCFDIMWTY